MIHYVEGIYQIFFGHLIGFISRNALSNRAKILSGFLRAILAPFGGQIWLSYGYCGTITSILGLSSVI